MGGVRGRLAFVSAAVAVAAIFGWVVSSSNGGEWSNGGASAQALRLVPVATGLDSPVQVVAAPGELNRLYVVEQGGLIRVLEGGRLRATPFLDVRGKISTGNEQGLLGLAFPPDYAKSRLLVVNYTDRSGTTRVVRYRSNTTRALPGSARVLLSVPQPYSNHNGGMVLFGPDKLLYVGLGDGGSGGDPENRAQDMSTLLGKLVRLDARKASPRPVIRALGLRNPWRYSFDRANGDLWIGDVGQGMFEEIDVARGGVGGLNFGWKVMEGNHCYGNESACDTEGLTGPITEYGRDLGCTVIGGYVYRGAAYPFLVGTYLFADYCEGRIMAIDAAATEIVEPATVGTANGQISAFGEDVAGELYVTNLGGTVSRVVATQR